MNFSLNCKKPNLLQLILNDQGSSFWKFPKFDQDTFVAQNSDIYMHWIMSRKRYLHLMQTSVSFSTRARADKKVKFSLYKFRMITYKNQFCTHSNLRSQTHWRTHAPTRQKSLGNISPSPYSTSQFHFIWFSLRSLSFCSQMNTRLRLIILLSCSHLSTILMSSIFHHVYGSGYSLKFITGHPFANVLLL